MAVSTASYSDKEIETPNISSGEPAPITVQIHTREVIVATITAYSSSPEQTDDTPYLTASGERVHSGGIACPNRYPFGTLVEIDGKMYYCNDRMGPKYENENRFDIWMETESAARVWGKKKTTVTIREESSE